MIGRAKVAQAIAALRTMARSDPDPDVREAITQLLKAKQRDEPNLDSARKVLSDTGQSTERRLRALRVIADSIW